MLIEALGIVFLCGVLAIYFEVSILIATIIMGMIITNFAKYNDYPFHAIEGVEWPFMVIFFVRAGASLEFTTLSSIGLIGTAYVLFRTIGKYIGSLLGSLLAILMPILESGWALLYYRKQVSPLIWFYLRQCNFQNIVRYYYP